MANRKIKAELEVDGKDNTSPAFRSVAKNIGNVEKRLAQFNRQAAAFNRTSAEFNKRVFAIDRASAAMSKRHEAVSRTTEEMGLVAARFLGPAALGAGFVYSVKQAADFQESLVNIQKKAGATGEQMEKMRGEILELGHVMPVSMDEIAKGFERGAAAGIPLDELKEYAALSVKVADAWGTSAEETANFFAGFNASMHIKYGAEMKNYASLINDLGDSGIADEKDIGDFVDRFGGSGTNFGLTPQQIAAYGASLLDLKMPAEVGARAMNTLTSALLAPENLSKKAHKGLEEIVGDVGKFAKLSGNEKLRVFIKDLSQMTGQRRTSLLGALLGQGFSDEIARLVAGRDIVEQNLSLAEKETHAASNSVDRVYEQRMTLFNSQIAVLQNNVKQLAVRLGDMVLPTTNNALTAVNDAFSDADAQQVALKGLTWQQEDAQRKEYVDRWEKLHPAKGLFDRFRQSARATDAYGQDLARVGRGQMQDLFDGLSQQERQKFLNDHYMEWPDEALRRFPGNNDLATPNHGYSIRNLPRIGPTPSMRPQPGRAADTGIGIGAQYAEYHAGQLAMRQAQPLASIPSRDPDLSQTLENLRKLEDSGQATWRAAGEDAGQKVADGGKQGADAISHAAEDIRSAGQSVAAAISQAAAAFSQSVSDAKAVANASKAGGQIGAMFNRGPDFNPGRSMAPDVTAPNSKTVSGPTGGGGF